MGHLLLLRPAASGEGGYEALLQRRGKHLREAYHWCIPGGGYDSVRFVLKNTTDFEIKWKIGRRAALREFIEECGGGFHPTLPQSTHTVGAIPEEQISAVTFRKVLIPPGIVNIVDQEELVTSFSVPYGTAGKLTSVFCYLMREGGVDSEFLVDWVPRAIPHYRAEVDEWYDKAGCRYGYVWVSLDAILSDPTHPVPSSSMPLCQFVTNLFTLFGDKIRPQEPRQEREEEREDRSREEDEEI
jgi:8-oxo-dGTP pyrophosphatase MutT (NUDIX family)